MGLGYPGPFLFGFHRQTNVFQFIATVKIFRRNLDDTEVSDAARSAATFAEPDAHPVFWVLSGYMPLCSVLSELLLRHGRRVMTGNEPLFAIPPIGIGVTRSNRGARFGESKRIKTRVYSIVATNIYHSQINFP